MLPQGTVKDRSADCQAFTGWRMLNLVHIFGGMGYDYPGVSDIGCCSIVNFPPRRISNRRGIVQITAPVHYNLPHWQMSKCSSRGLYLGNKIAVPVK